MKFRLIYDGALPAERNGRRDIKQSIRRCMHEQIKQVLASHPSFKPYTGPDDINLIGREWADDELTKREKVGKFTFASLVTDKHWRTCSLDILLLRKANRIGVLHNGDIDNRIKTLLDGLRAPQQATELPEDDLPKNGEDPFYCLLSDDKVINGFSVKTDQLLTPVDSPENKEYARVIIEVSVQISRMLMSNLPFLVN